ncbi:hypothetical protein RAS1_24920 [Phycisphaerae bacterium RAS1]|nr:hypothetical protein RAS1_24920 [Phycisphaerae bacterium RAS1]
MIRAADFVWVDWNLNKIDAHGLSISEVEFAWRYRFGDEPDEHPIRGQFFRSYGPCPSGRVIRIIWRWNSDAVADRVFVLSAHGNWSVR